MQSYDCYREECGAPHDFHPLPIALISIGLLLNTNIVREQSEWQHRDEDVLCTITVFKGTTLPAFAVDP